MESCIKSALIIELWRDFNKSHPNIDKKPKNARKIFLISTRRLFHVHQRDDNTADFGNTGGYLGFEASEGFISDVTDKLLRQIEDWQNRPLSKVYPVLYIDAIPYSVRDNSAIRKLAAYVVLGINSDGLQEFLTIEVGGNESTKYRLSVLNGLKKHGIKDILILCADGLTGIKEAVAAAFPKTEYQRCIVHQVRNALKYISDKDRKLFAANLKTIY